MEAMKASEQFPQGTEARVCEDIAERQALGVSKYGTTVERNPLCLLEWLEHAYQECLDQAVYIKRAMEEMQRNTNATGWAVNADVPQGWDDKLQLREGWRWLEIGEVVQEGDEAISGNEKWIPVRLWGFNNPYEKAFARKVAEVPPPSPEPVKKSPLACDSMDPCDCMVRQWVGKCPHVKIDYTKLAADIAKNCKEIDAMGIEFPQPPEPEEFKAGDWVVVNDGGLLDGRVCQLNEVGHTVGYFTDSFGANVCMNLNRFRRAEPHEIQQQADGWIEWKGGACPVNGDTIVEVRFRSGLKATDRARDLAAEPDQWRDDTNRGDIVAYRIVQQAEPVLAWEVMVCQK